MRILMLSQFYAPVVGGEERHVQDLSVELVRRGHKVAVATLWMDGTPEFEEVMGVRVYRVRSTTQRADWLYREPDRRHAPPLPDPEALWGLRRVFQREEPDVVHAHNWFVHSFLPLSLWSRAALVVTLHDYSLVCAKRRMMYRNAPCTGARLVKCLGCAAEHYGLLKGAATALASSAMGVVERKVVDMFIPVSGAVAAGNNLVGSRLPFRVIPNFVADDTETRAPGDEAYLAQLPRTDFLLYVGDLSGEKGLYVLLEAYARLGEAPPLVLIGRRCNDTPASLPRNVTWLGIWPHAMVLEARRRSSLALIPSIWPEPFGIVAIEAMAMGCPVIASDIGGLRDLVVDGQTGVLTAPGDVEGLQRAMRALIDSPDLRQRMGEAGRRQVGMFRAGAIVPQIEQVYQTVCKNLRPEDRIYPLKNEESGLHNV